MQFNVEEGESLSKSIRCIIGILQALRQYLHYRKQNILSMLPTDPFMSYLDFLLGYSTGELQILHLIVLVLFGAVDRPHASDMLVHFLEINNELYPH